MGVGVKPGQVCWCCREPGHFQDQCHMMPVGALVWVTKAPHASPDRVEIYRIPVSIKGVTYYALVDSGCNLSLSMSGSR